MKHAEETFNSQQNEHSLHKRMQFLLKLAKKFVAEIHTTSKRRALTDRLHTDATVCSPSGISSDRKEIRCATAMGSDSRMILTSKEKFRSQFKEKTRGSKPTMIRNIKFR
jgi:hypothetical protein